MAKLELPIVQGDTIRQTYTLKTGTTVANAAAINLTGCTIRVQVRPNVADVDGTADPLLEFTTVDGTISTPTTDGKVNLVWDDVTETTGTRNPALADAIFDIEVTYPDSTKVTYPPADSPRGVVVFANEVTR